MRIVKSIKLPIPALIVFIFSVVQVFSANFDREPGFEYLVITEPYTPKPHKPKQYVIYRTVDRIIVDGKMDESSWVNADWTNRFDHLLMVGYQKPFLSTRAKMLWDENNLYLAVELEEPNLLGHVIINDDEIYDDNDIEFFIDVDNDSQNYIELEFNCLGTVWDMYLYKEYARGGLPFSHPKMPESKPWDLEGMLVAVQMDGSINYPFDTDRGWTIEISIPWESLQKTSRTEEKLNRNGSFFRLNMSRVQHPWPRDVWPIMDWKNRGGPCWDWTWSPNLVYNMHSIESFSRIILSERTVLQSRDMELENAFPFAEPPEPRKKPHVGSMVKIKGGKYSIGPDFSDPDASPEGSVTLNDFYIDRYEVTIGEFVKFLNTGGKDEHYHIDMGNTDLCGVVKKGEGQYEAVPGKEYYPIVFVTLDAAKEYAKWVGKRLPTEYEWEAAARGKNARLYPWGNKPATPDRANYNYIVGYPTQVGSYEKGKTPEGIYDMAGNVWELIDGKWEEYPWCKDSKGRTGSTIMRGGSWVTTALNLKSTYRNGTKSGRCAMFGFRCAKDVR